MPDETDNGKTEAPNQKEQPVKISMALTRREFVVTLGAGLSIAGFCLVGNKQTEIFKLKAGLSNNVARPCLRDDVVLGSDGDIYTIRLKSGGGLTCGMNHVGKSVLQRMDGRNTIKDIAGSLSREFDIPEDDALKANLAFFATQIGMLGLLKEPFYVTIFERTT